MTEKNENIYLFIIKEDYAAKSKVKQNFVTTARALDEIFGPNLKF
jgi:hypothetical protein